jgi:hypothetical protein
MTVVAVIAARKMPGVLSGGYCSVMTRRAAAEHLGVIDRKHRRPNIRGMAVFANVAG